MARRVAAKEHRWNWGGDNDGQRALTLTFLVLTPGPDTRDIFGSDTLVSFVRQLTRGIITGLQPLSTEQDASDAPGAGARQLILSQFMNEL